MRFKNYINRYNKKNRIYSEEELLAMTLNELLNNESLIMAQDSDIGIPSYEELRKSPNTRWIDSFINKDGQKDGGFFGSILENDFGDYTKPKQNVFDSIKPFAEQYPEPIIKVDKVPTRIIYENEEAPYVLEGGVEENVYNESEDETEPNIYIPDDDEEERGKEPKAPYELNDEDLADILQSIMKSTPSSNFQIEPLLEDNSFPTLPQTDTLNIPPVSLPQLKTSLNQEELKEMWEKLLEELRKMLAKYKGLSNTAKFQKAMSKAVPDELSLENEYYKNALKMKDGEPLTPKFIEENDIYNYQDITDPEKSNYYKEQLAKMYGLDMNAPDINEKLKDKKIVVPKETSRLYQYAMNSDALQKWVSENYDKIKNGESYNNNIEFPLKMNKQDIGMYATIHRAKLNNMKINPDGSITGRLRDPFNFEKWQYQKFSKPSDYKKNIETLKHNVATAINNVGYEQQQTNKLEPFFIDMPINISGMKLREINNKPNK